MTTQTLDISTLCAWTEPKKVNTKMGPRILRTASPNEAFSKLWKQDKEAMKAAGLGWNKSLLGEWQICWWSVDGEAQTEAKATIAESRAAEPLHDVVIPVPEGLAYLDYQRAGIAWAMARPAALIADEMGLGKTIQGIGVINADEEIRRVLVICPASLKLNWQREMEKWLTRKLRIGIAAGKFWPGAVVDIVIVNYDICAKHAERIHGEVWDLVIMDEAHYCKNPKAQRTRALLGGGKEKRPEVQARRKIVLTGTPILNRPIEAQPILGFLDKDTFGNFFHFANRYCGAKRGRFGWDFSGATNLDELQQRLRSTVMIRRLKADVLTELPAKRRQVIEIAGDAHVDLLSQERGIEERHRDMMQSLREALELARVLENKAAYADAVEKLRMGQQAMFTEMAEIRHAVALEKVPYVVEHVSDAVESGPVVLFAHHRDVVAGLVAGLREQGRRVVSLVGGMSDEEKQSAVDDFQSGAADVFVGNLKAAGVGITLVRSSHVVFCELDWVPANMSQAEDRCHRIGQRDSVLVQHIVLEGSLDQIMAKALVRKQDVADKALDDPTTAAEAQEPVETVTITAKDAEDRPERRPVSTEMPSRDYSADEIRRLLAGLQTLAAMCDGAHSVDGSGFNKCDSQFGKGLSRQATLSPRQAAVAERLCRKYRRQIGDVLS